MTPDPEAVRRALSEIECVQAEMDKCASMHNYLEARDVYMKHARLTAAAARAWLAQQDGEASDAT